MSALSSPAVRSRLRRIDLTLGMPRLTRRGWAVLAAATVAVIVAFSVGWRDLLYVGLVLAALVLVSALSVRARVASLSATRRNSPEVISVGERAHVQIQVTNNAWLRSSPQLWRDLTPRGFEPRPFDVLPSLGARGDGSARRRLDYQLEPHERGAASIGPLVVERSDPFGLTLHERIVGDVAPLTVLPRITPLEGAVAGRTAPRGPRGPVSDSRARRRR